MTNLKKTLLSASLAFLFVGCATTNTQVQTHPANEAGVKDKTHAKSDAKHENHFHWGYSKENGPEHWGQVSAICSQGHAQSPINIASGETVPMNHQYDLHLNEDIHTAAKIIDNGHSIKVTPKVGGTLEFNGETFRLLQFHFHGKSEHTIDGKRYDLVAHLVHQNPKTKQLAVVAVLFEEGKANKVIDKVIKNMGSEAKINLQDLLPADTAHYYHYVGSLTTPPCSENVQWYVLKKPQTASKEQIEELRKYYTDNQRPVQMVYNRKIESN